MFFFFVPMGSFHRHVVDLWVIVNSLFKFDLDMIPGLSKRWETIFFLISGVFISYCIRVSMSVACVKISEELGW
jgi:hypothetical protein